MSKPVKKLRNKITTLVNKIDSLDDLTDIDNFLQRKSINIKIDKFLKKKSIDNLKLTEWLSSVISKSKCSAEQKHDFCDLLLSQCGLDCPFRIIESEGKMSLYDTEGYLAESLVFQDIKEKVVKQTSFRNHLTGSPMGAGELFMTLFYSECTADKLSKGDIILRNQHIEVKSSRGAISGTRGYVAPNVVDIVQTLFNESGFMLDTSSMSFYRWESLNQGIRDQGVNAEHVKSAYKTVFKALYPLPESDKIINRYLDLIFTEESLVHNETMMYFSMLQFEYYQELNKFDSILLINPVSMEGLMLRSAQDIKKYWDILWVESFEPNGSTPRTSVSRISLK